MEKVSGYKGLDGVFYETEKECNKADLDFKVRCIEIKLDNFYTSLSDYFALETTGLTHKDFITHRKYILDIVAKKVLENSEDFIEVVNKKKYLKKELDELKKQQDKENTGWNIFEKWWLRNKWW